ncbi:methyltransferase domain-containing protein [Sorangium sp. So ce1335]|uniref:methyltransferase domain-containing protein n=1 Tax=Sorangium sp. So ce1335 TaxID=3133335 RepID=UPI003F5F5D30
MTSERPRNPLAASAQEGGVSGEPGGAPLPGEAGSAAAQAPQGEPGAFPARPSSPPRPERMPSTRPQSATATPLPRLDVVAGMADGSSAGSPAEIPDLDLDPRIAGPPTERSRPGAPLPPGPGARRSWQSLAAEAERTSEVERGDSAKVARRRSRRLVNLPGDAPQHGDAQLAAHGDSATARARSLQDVQDDDGWLDVGARPSSAPVLEEPRPAARPSSTPPPNLAAELVAPRAVPRPSPKSSSSVPPMPTPSGFIIDPDSVAVIRPLQILSIESNLPPVSSQPEPARPPVDEPARPAPARSVVDEPARPAMDEPAKPPLDEPARLPADEAARPPLLTEPTEHEWPPLQFRIRSELPTVLGLEAYQDGVSEGPPTARDAAYDTAQSEAPRPRKERAVSAPEIEARALDWPLGSGGEELAEVEPEPELVDEARAEQPSASPAGDEVERAGADLTRSTLPPKSGEVELVEVEPERDAEAADEARADAQAPQPKKPPPPLPPRRPRAMASPDLATFTSSVPPPPVSAPPPAPHVEPPVAARPSAPAAAPAAKPIEVEPSSGPSTEPAARRKRPWWEDLFGDDFVRTLDKIDPKVVRREVDFIEERLGVEKGAVILDLACGTGSHAIEIASRGYSVVGYDLSLAMLARAADDAQDRGQKLNFLQGDMREMTFEETFDGIYCWSTSFGYFDDEKNADVLARIRRALRSGGMLLLDIVNRDYVASRQPSLVWFEGDGCVCMDEMQVDFFTSRLKVKRTVMFEDGRSREIDYSIRLYGLHELGKMLHEAGFKVTEVTGHPAHPGVFFGSESPRLIILAERS